MGDMSINGMAKQPLTPVPQASPRPAPPPADEDAGALDGWRSQDISFAATFQAGRLKGAQTFLVGARAEAGNRIAEGQHGSLWLIADVSAGVGNGVLLGAGAGLRGEIGSDHRNVYATLMPRLNGGFSMNGLTGGVSARAAAGVHLGDFFGEVAHEIGTNLRMTTASVGVRARF